MKDKQLDRRIARTRKKLARSARKDRVGRVVTLEYRLRRLEQLRALDPAARPQPAVKTAATLAQVLKAVGGLVPVAGPALVVSAGLIDSLPAVRQLAQGDDGERGDDAVDADARGPRLERPLVRRAAAGVHVAADGKASGGSGRTTAGSCRLLC